MLLVIADKRSINQHLKQLLGNDEKVDIIYTLSYGVFSPEYPKITFNDIPATPPYNENALRPYVSPGPDVPWCVNWVMRSGSVAELLSYINQHKSQYTEVIVAVASDRVGSYSGDQLLKRLDLDSKIPVNYLHLTSYHTDALRKAMLKRAPGTVMREESVAQQRIKRTLDYWWRLNAQVVLGEACTKAGLVAHPQVSKYELLMYYFFADKVSASTNDALKYMEKPVSKKPYLEKIGGDIPTIGSPASRSEILNTMIQRGALEEVASRTSRHDRKYGLTQEARRFLSYMHPKTRDDDLPFRVLTWMNSPLSEVPQTQEKVQRYINQLFGRQLRYQRKRFQEDNS